jgi:hypothetical protein
MRDHFGGLRNQRKRHGMAIEATSIEISDLQAGKAGEYLVCADLILGGHIAFPSEQGLPFDVVAEARGRLIRIQVKTTRALRSVPQRVGRHQGYLFHVKRAGKRGKKVYGAGAVDIFALVSLDSREIGYLAAKDVKQTMIFRSPHLEGQYQDEALAQRTKAILALRAEGLSYTQIAQQVGVDRAFAQRVCKGRSGKMRASRYLRDFSFEDALKRAVI